MEQVLQLTDWESSEGFLLMLSNISGPSSPAAIASMEAAMPALSLWAKTRFYNDDSELRTRVHE